MTRRKHTSKFKFKVVLEAPSERTTIQELGRKHKIHPAQITNWKTQFMKNGEEVFSKKAKSAKTEAEEKGGSRFFKDGLVMSKSKKERKKLVEKRSKLSVVRQCELLDIHRSGAYYEPRGETDLNLELMHTIDEKNLLHPWLGVPRIHKWLQKDKGMRINKKRVERPFRLMGLSATGPNPNISKRGKGELHRIYKYLLGNLKVERPGQVWAMDITYIPVQGGYLYLCAIIDLYSRYVVGWSLSNTMASEWCRKTVEAAAEEHGAPEILNTGQGSQFTSIGFAGYVTKEKEIRLSMDGKGRALDNIFVERLWRSVKSII